MYIIEHENIFYKKGRTNLLILFVFRLIKHTFSYFNTENIDSFLSEQKCINILLSAAIPYNTSCYTQWVCRTILYKWRNALKVLNIQVILIRCKHFSNMGIIISRIHAVTFLFTLMSNFIRILQEYLFKKK